LTSTALHCYQFIIKKIVSPINFVYTTIVTMLFQYYKFFKLQPIVCSS